MTSTDTIGRLTLDKAVKLNPYVPRPATQREAMTDDELMSSIWKFGEKGGILAVDVECYSNYFLVAFKHLQSGKITTWEPHNSVRKLSWIMQSYKTIGFNSIKYDLPMIWYAHYGASTEQLKELSNDLIFGNVWWQEAQKKYDFTNFKTNHIDLIEVAPLKGSLKLYGARLHSKRIQDLPFAHDAPLSSDQIPIVMDYCFNDLDNTELLYTNLLEPLKLRTDLSIQYKQDLMSKSDAQIAEAIISSELKNLTEIWPKKPKIEPQSFCFKVPSYLAFQTPQAKRVLDVISSTTFETEYSGHLKRPKELEGLTCTLGLGIYRLGLGGLHSSEKGVSYQSNETYQLRDFDASSYYPVTVLNQNLYPPHLGLEFLTVYRGLSISRLKDKKEGRISQSECKKIAINGTVGKTLSPYSVLYDPPFNVQVTLTGQLSLIMLIEQFELSGIQVVSANTDGVLVYCKKSQIEACNMIVKMWEQITGFTTEETQYASYYARDVNAYLAMKADGSFKGKNDYYDPWRGKTGKDQYWKFQKNPTAQICIEAIEKLLSAGIAVDQTIKNCLDITKFVSVMNVTGGAHKNGDYLGKTIRWYYAKNEYGTINRVLNNNKVPDTEGAKPLMDLSLELPSDLNYDWYVSKANEMLYDLNYLKRERQVSFF